MVRLWRRSSVRLWRRSSIRLRGSSRSIRGWGHVRPIWRVRKAETRHQDPPIARTEHSQDPFYHPKQNTTTNGSPPSGPSFEGLAPNARSRLVIMQAYTPVSGSAWLAPRSVDDSSSAAVGSHDGAASTTSWAPAPRDSSVPNFQTLIPQAQDCLLQRACRMCSTDMLRDVLGSDSAKSQIKSHEGLRALMTAISGLFVDGVSMLMEAGADVHLRTGIATIGMSDPARTGADDDSGPVRHDRSFCRIAPLLRILSSQGGMPAVTRVIDYARSIASVHAAKPSARKMYVLLETYESKSTVAATRARSVVPWCVS